MSVCGYVVELKQVEGFNAEREGMRREIALLRSVVHNFGAEILKQERKSDK